MGKYSPTKIMLGQRNRIDPLERKMLEQSECNAEFGGIAGIVRDQPF